jgi:hypothetical protein
LADPPQPTGTPTDPAVEWTCHPVRHRPVAAVLVTAFLVLLVLGIQLAFGDPFLTALGAAILAASLAPFYLPTRYRMSQDGVAIRTAFGAREKPWDLYRRWEADRHGVLISPFDHPSRLDRLHGLNLRFDPPDRDRVLVYLRNRLHGHDRQG